MPHTHSKSLFQWVRRTAPTRVLALVALGFQPACATANRAPHSGTVERPVAERPSQSFPSMDAVPVADALVTETVEPGPENPESQESTAPVVEEPVAFVPLQPPPVAAPPEPVPPEWQRERTVILDRLVQASRRLYDAAPPEQRSDLLVGMLADDIPEMRTLGLALVEEELADAQRLAPDVGVALARLLSSPEARVRLASARLLNRLAQPGLEDYIAAALDVETDAPVVAELLAAASRQPSARLVAPTLRWLGQETAARESASQAALALDRADLLTDEHRTDAAAKLRARSVTSLSAPGIRLFARVGTDEDRQSLVPLLKSPETATRLAAAESLARYPTFVDVLVLAAIDDPSLVDIAVRAIATNRPTIDGLLLLRSLAFPTQEARLAAASQVTAGMDLGTLILAADESSRVPSFVEAILGSLADAPFPADPELAILHARGLVRLAESQLNLSRPGRALSLADRAETYEPALPDRDEERLERVRTIALVWLDRLDDPGLDGSVCDHWLDALELLGALPQGADISEALLARFGSSLTPEQLVRHAEIEARLLTGPRQINRSTPADVPERANTPIQPPDDGPR